MSEQADRELKGFYKLNWIQRIGFGAGDLAQNFIFQVVGSYILFYYTDVFELGGDSKSATAIASVMFLVVRIIDVIWDPIVGAFVDKRNPKWGKYRTYLIVGGIPLTILAILNFWDQFRTSVPYAIFTYSLLQICYTLVNVPYGALNASLTRDTEEITILTSTRMFMANLGGLFVGGGVPIIVALFAGDKIPTKYVLFQALGALPSFIFMPLVPAIKKLVGKKNMFYIFLVVAIIGYILMYIISVMGVEDYIVLMYIAQFIKGSGFTVATGYMWALVPEVISFGEYTTGRRISGIVNALTGMFFKAGMAIGQTLPGIVLYITSYDGKATEKANENQKEDDSSLHLPNDPKAWFLTMLCYSLVGFVLLVFCFSQCKERVVMDAKETENVKVRDLFVEFVRNRPLRVIAFFFITAFATMFIHNSSTAYLMNQATMNAQKDNAKFGIRCCVSVIPAILLLLCVFIISRYELTDEKIDEINKEIEERQMKAEQA